MRLRKKIIMILWTLEYLENSCSPPPNLYSSQAVVRTTSAVSVCGRHCNIGSVTRRSIILRAALALRFFGRNRRRNMAGKNQRVILIWLTDDRIKPPWLLSRSCVLGFKIPESFKMHIFKRSSQQISWSLLGHMTYIILNYRSQKKFPCACFAILLIFQGPTRRASKFKFDYKSVPDLRISKYGAVNLSIHN